MHFDIINRKIARFRQWKIVNGRAVCFELEITIIIIIYITANQATCHITTTIGEEEKVMLSVVELRRQHTEAAAIITTSMKGKKHSKYNSKLELLDDWLQHK